MGQINSTLKIDFKDNETDFDPSLQTVTTSLEQVAKIDDLLQLASLAGKYAKQQVKSESEVKKAQSCVSRLQKKT